MNGRKPVPTTRVRLGIGAFVVALCVAAAPPARADEAAAAPSAAELAAARQLFGDALAAADQGRWREALEAFLRVEKIITSPQVHYQIGLCHERLGELVEALNQFEMAIQAAEVKRAPDVVKESRAHADVVRQKVARLVLRVPADATGVVITIDGRPVNAALVGTAMPLNPGDRRVAVRAENYAAAFEGSLQVAPGESRTLAPDLGAKKILRVATPTPTVPIVVVAASPAPGAPPSPKRNYVPAIVAGSATLALTVGAVATGVAAHADYSQYIRENVTPPTTPEAQRASLRSAGIGKAWASTALTLGALAGAGVTIYLVVRAPTEQAPPKALAWSPWALPGGAGLAVRGAL